MKLALPISIFVLAVISASFNGEAQGTLYLSSINTVSTNYDSVASDAWLAMGFLTGTNASGYTLNDIQLAMSSANGSPSGFTVLLYSNALPSSGSSLGALNGSGNPSASGIYDYTASGITLLPATWYYLVLTAATSTTQGSYPVLTQIAGPFTLIDGWNWSLLYVSANGLNWNYERAGLFQYAVYATAVPEPATDALAGLSLAGFCLWRGLPRMRKAHPSK